MFYATRDEYEDSYLDPEWTCRAIRVEYAQRFGDPISIHWCPGKRRKRKRFGDPITIGNTMLGGCCKTPTANMRSRCAREI